MKNRFKKIVLASAVFASVATFQSCSLEETNPGGFTMDAMAENEESYQTLINQCHFAMQRYFYGTDNWMTMTEGDTDLWTYQGNKSNTWTQWFWFFSGASPNTTYTTNWWNGTYDGVGSCNIAIELGPKVPFKTEAARNAKIAEARFLRAIYYFNAVEQFGAVTVITEPVTTPTFKPERTEPMKVYEEVIIPDLKFAFEWLTVGDHATTSTPTKKAALGFLAKACLQTIAYDPSKKYATDALAYAKMLIADAEAGGGTYNTYMYETYKEVFDEANNWNNKEALWKHRWASGDTGHGSSNGNYKLNRNNEYFNCKIFNFGAITETQEYLLSYEGNPSGLFMPTQHLLNLYVQEDGALDPRFHQSFATEWKANMDYTWDKATVQRYDRESTIEGKKVANGALAVKFILPQDAGYAAESAGKLKQDYLVVDYKDIYNDAKKSIHMTYAYQNPSGNYTSDGKSENLFNYFYPSLTKHNSSRFFVANESKKRNGNLNATFMMRTSEVYLIAAEADIYVNGGSGAMGYINKVRTRAGAKPLNGAATIRTVLDERGRELCGEYCRFYDLKRTGMFKNADYLEETHPDLAPFFKPEFALRPISTTYTATLEGGGSYYQNPGY